MCETCDRHRPIIIKDEPEAFRARLRRIRRLDSGDATLAELYGRATNRSFVITDKGRSLLAKLFGRDE